MKLILRSSGQTRKASFSHGEKFGRTMKSTNKKSTNFLTAFILHYFFYCSFHPQKLTNSLCWRIFSLKNLKISLSHTWLDKLLIKITFYLLSPPLLLLCCIGLNLHKKNQTQTIFVTLKLVQKSPAAVCTVIRKLWCMIHWRVKPTASFRSKKRAMRANKDPSRKSLIPSSREYFSQIDSFQERWVGSM